MYAQNSYKYNYKYTSIDMKRWEHSNNDLNGKEQSQ